MLIKTSQNKLCFTFNFQENKVKNDLGYDVWMMNNRGTTYSRNHTKFCPTCQEFWNFSWHESAIGDYPATIDYILKTTKQQSLYFIGHSMGGTQYLVSQGGLYRATLTVILKETSNLPNSKFAH